MLPWEEKIHLIYEVPMFPTGNKNEIVGRKGSRRIQKTEAAKLFTEQIHWSTYEICKDMQRNPPPTLQGIKFPLLGKEIPLRLDMYFLFSLSGKGRQRMKLTDMDNLIKGFQDGLNGVLFDDDRHIWESFICKGDAPTDKGDVIMAVLSRAGIRSFEQARGLSYGMPCFPPWTRKEQAAKASPIIQMPKRIILP